MKKWNVTIVGGTFRETANTGIAPIALPVLVVKFTIVPGVMSELR
jgi:hypothetical protein